MFSILFGFSKTRNKVAGFSPRPFESFLIDLQVETEKRVTFFAAVASSTILTARPTPSIMPWSWSVTGRPKRASTTGSFGIPGALRGV